MKTKYEDPTIQKIKAQEKNIKSDLELHCSFFPSVILNKNKQKTLNETLILINTGIK
jgi:hypothetical protein